MSDKRVIKAALLGAGVVGSGVYELAQILAKISSTRQALH